jgi:hypothetical protein
MRWATLAINKKNHRINLENCCYRSRNYHYTSGYGTSVAHRGSAVGRRQCSCKTSSHAARPHAADAAPPRYRHIRGISIALRTTRSARVSYSVLESNRMHLICTPSSSFAHMIDDTSVYPKNIITKESIIILSYITESLKTINKRL